jgi:hypothetical protein
VVRVQGSGFGVQVGLARTMNNERGVRSETYIMRETVQCVSWGSLRQLASGGCAGVKICLIASYNRIDSGRVIGMVYAFG